MTGPQTCGICNGIAWGAHHHEPECAACGSDFLEAGTVGLDGDGAPYCVACGADLREGIAWTVGGAGERVTVIPGAGTDWRTWADEDGDR